MPLYAVLAREYFAQSIMGTVLGGATMLSSIGMALGPVGGGWIFDTFGNYSWLYIGSGRPRGRRGADLARLPAGCRASGGRRGGRLRPRPIDARPRARPSIGRARRPLRPADPVPRPREPRPAQARRPTGCGSRSRPGSTATVPAIAGERRLRLRARLRPFRDHAGRLTPRQPSRGRADPGGDQPLRAAPAARAPPAARSSPRGPTPRDAEGAGCWRRPPSTSASPAASAGCCPRRG